MKNRKPSTNNKPVVNQLTDSDYKAISEAIMPMMAKLSRESLLANLPRKVLSQSAHRENAR